MLYFFQIFYRTNLSPHRLNCGIYNKGDFYTSRHQTGFSQGTAGNLAQTTSKDERDRTRIEKVVPLTLETSDGNWVNQATKQETEIPKTRTDALFWNSFGQSRLNTPRDLQRAIHYLDQTILLPRITTEFLILSTVLFSNKITSNITCDTTTAAMCQRKVYIHHRCGHAVTSLVDQCGMLFRAKNLRSFSAVLGFPRCTLAQRQKRSNKECLMCIEKVECHSVRDREVVSNKYPCKQPDLSLAPKAPLMTQCIADCFRRRNRRLPILRAV